MQVTTKQGLQTLRRVQTFLESHPFDVALGDLELHTQTLSAIVQRLEQYALTQGSRTRQARELTMRKLAFGQALREEYLRPIARLARSLFPDDAALRTAFELPKGRDDEGLLQGARSIADRARAHSALFVAKGLAPNFVERLEGAITAFGDAHHARGMEIARRSSASASILQEMALGREQVRLLDAMLAPRLRGNHGLRAEWRSCTRFGRVGVESGGEGGAVGAPTGGATGGTTVVGGGSAPEVMAA